MTAAANDPSPGSPARPVAILTGATGGIGRATTRALIAAGWDVVAVARRQERLDALIAGIDAKSNVHALAADIVADGAADAIVAQAKRRGPLDLLVNVAGLMPWGLAVDTKREDLVRCFEVNVFGTYLMSVAAARAMPEGAAIINVASSAGLRALTERSIYCASKAAVVQLTRCLALEWAPRKIAVNAVAPGVVLTPRISRLLAEDSPIIESVREATATGAFPTPEDVAQSIVLLARQNRSLVIGQVWGIDAGWAIL